MSFSALLTKKNHHSLIDNTFDSGSQQTASHASKLQYVAVKYSIFDLSNLVLERCLEW